ncbi:aspartate/glutamate racemase family protein [Candidatus Hodarchaeum mangrovi]
MKLIGLIGGISWESTQEYYHLINKYVNMELGGYHSASCILYSVDFQTIHSLQLEENWNAITTYILNIASKLVKAGAELLLICSNTIHIIAEEIERDISIPLVHIADATGKEIKKAGCSTIGLLGTILTMEKDFYRNRLNKFKIQAIIPNRTEREVIQQIIFSELVFGEVKDSSREKILNIIANLRSRGADGIVLGCTELPLLIQNIESLPLFNTTAIHAKAVVNLALEA